jgi:hypothetical protein
MAKIKDNYVTQGIRQQNQETESFLNIINSLTNQCSSVL